MFRSALVAFVCAMISQEVAGRPSPLYLDASMIDRSIIHSSGGLFEFEDAQLANGFLRQRREKRQAPKAEVAPPARSFRPPKQTPRPVNPKLRLNHASSARPTATQAPPPSVIPSSSMLAPPPPKPTSCFPGPGTSSMSIPTTLATASSLQDWWCPQSEEYAFMGFSYSIAGCPSKSQMIVCHFVLR